MNEINIKFETRLGRLGTWPGKWDTARLAALGGVMIVGLAGMIAGLSQFLRQQDAAVAWVAHTLEVLERVASLEADLQSAISNHRGFIVSHDLADRAAAEAASRQVESDSAALRRLTADNPAQEEAITRLEDMLTRRLEMSRRMADTIIALGPQVAPDPAMFATARAGAAEVIGALADIKAVERRLLAQRQDDAARVRGWLWGQLSSCAAVIAACIALSLLLVTRRRQERRHISAVEQLNTQLEATVAHRTHALAESEAKLRAYFDHSATGILILRRYPDGRIVHDDVNPAFAAMARCAPDTLLGRSIQEIWPPDHVASATARVETCLATGEPQIYTAQRRLGGALRWIDIAMAPGPRADGDERGAVVVLTLRDVTRERELADQVLVQAKAQLEAVEREAAFFANSPDVMTVIGVHEQNGEVTFAYEAVSPAFETCTGRAAAEVLGKPPTEWMPPALARRMLAVYHHCLVTGRQTTWAETFDAGRGTIDAEGVVNPVRDTATGRITRLVVTVRDVTERNRMAAAMQHGQRIEAIGRIAAGVAHDFNNILQAVLASLDLIRDDLPDGAPACRFADVAISAATRGATLTRHLLGYSRKELLRPEAIEPAPFLQEMCTLMARVLPPNITVALDVAPGTPACLADTALLQTALLNLAVNAGHAMADGGTLRLEAALDSASPEALVVIAVVDTGVGMDADTLARATEPFFSTKGTKGSGLGLSMVHGFAAQSGGELRIASTPGRGTRVELRLPQSEPGEPRPLIRVDRARSGGRLLLVDDMEDVLFVTGAFLIRAGFQVTLAANGEEALSRLAAGEPCDAIVCDFAMPGSNGIDLILASRRLRPGLPALVVTGYSDVDQNTALPDDVPVLSKPVARLELIDAVNQILRTTNTGTRKTPPHPGSQQPNPDREVLLSQL